MIVKASDVRGKPLLSIERGVRLDDVDDIVYDFDSHNVVGLKIKGGGMFSENKVVALSDVQEIGKDVVTIQSEQVVHNAKDVSDRMYSLMQQKPYFLNNSIVTEDGEKLGKISDVYFDSHTGAVHHFEVSQGLFGNAASGKKSIQPSEIITLGEDVTVVRTSTREKINEQADQQGLQGMYNDVKQKADVKMDDMIQKGQDTQYAAPQPPSYANMHDTNKFPEDMTFKQKAVAATTGAADAVLGKWNEPENQDRVDSAKDSLDDAKDAVVEKWHQLKQTVTAKTDETRAKMDEKRAADATGKYLAKTVFDPQTNVPIAQRGDVIDYNVVNRAREHGVLDQVIDNVTDSPVA